MNDYSDIELLRKDVEETRSAFEGVLKRQLSNAKKDPSLTGSLRKVDERSSADKILTAYENIGYNDPQLKLYIPFNAAKLYYQNLFKLNSALALPESLAVPAKTTTLESSLQEKNESHEIKNSKLFAKIAELELIIKEKNAELKLKLKESDKEPLREKVGQRHVPEELDELTLAQNYARDQYIDKLNVIDHRFDHSLALELLDQCLVKYNDTSSTSEIESYIQTETGLDTTKQGVVYAIEGFSQIISNIFQGTFVNKTEKLNFPVIHPGYAYTTTEQKLFNISSRHIVALSNLLYDQINAAADQSSAAEVPAPQQRQPADQGSDSLDGHDSYPQSQELTYEQGQAEPKNTALVKKGAPSEASVVIRSLLSEKVTKVLDSASKHQEPADEKASAFAGRNDEIPAHQESPVPRQYQLFEEGDIPTLYKDTKLYKYDDDSKASVRVYKEKDFTGEVLAKQIIANVNSAKKQFLERCLNKKVDINTENINAFVLKVIEFAQANEGVGNVHDGEQKWKEVTKDTEGLNQFSYKDAQVFSATYQKVSGETQIFTGRQENLRSDQQVAARLKRIPEDLNYRIEESLKSQQGQVVR